MTAGRTVALLVAVLSGLGRAGGHAAGLEPIGGGKWAGFVEPGFPFFSSVLDARRLGPGWPTNNLTPRGLILNLGGDVWACFDVDLLRVAAVWSGAGVTPVSMAQGSYHDAGRKAPEGQRSLPEIAGTPWCVAGIHPGGWVGGTPGWADPRPPGPDPTEVGRGAMAPEWGRFEGVQVEPDGVRLDYKIAGVAVRERWRTSGRRLPDGTFRARRGLEIGPAPQGLSLMVGRRPTGGPGALQVEVRPAGAGRLESPGPGVWVLRMPPSDQERTFDVLLTFAPGPRSTSLDAGSRQGVPAASAVSKPVPRWPQTVTTRGNLSRASDAYVLDDIALPFDNPWRRNVRAADLAFRPDGQAAVVTFDGDVWLVDGLRGDLPSVRWRRHASGFHEPLGVAYRDGELFVNDRNGIWRVRDTDGDGEADRHELFSNVFAQTAETREFATGFRVAPDGAFILAKGGQQTSTLGRDNGTVLRVAPDGRSYQTLGWGLREPFIGVHPRTGLVTASDQQGHYVPATPLHVIEGNRFYGFISLLLPKERYPAPIAGPATWIPHPVNASGASQVWLSGADLGPLNDAMVHLGYFRPELFLVRWNQRGTVPQAAVMSLARDLSFAPLNGAVNPADGRLFVTGFQIWGTVARQIAGLARLRHTGAPSPWPRDIVPMTGGVLLRFETPLEPAIATNVASYSVERWNYRRTAGYGSPHYRLDGSKGQETLWPAAVALSRDGRSVFVILPELRPVDQMRVGWSLAGLGGAGDRFASSAYFTPRELPPFRPEAEGFAPLPVDPARMSPGVSVAGSMAGTPAPSGTVPSAADGRRVAELMGCVACHSEDGTTVGKVGPTWKGLYLSPRELAGGGRAVADDAYLRESIRNPAVKIVRGYESGDVGMPSYEGILTEAQVEALVLHLKTLR